MTCGIDKRHVKAHLGVLPGGFRRDEFLRRGEQSGDLAWKQHLRRTRRGFRALDLDEHHAGAFPHDQVDFAGPAAPAPRRDGCAGHGVVPRDLILGGVSRQMRDAPPYPSRGSFSAA